MSYILDALRKVERERNQPVAPSINFSRPVEQPAKFHWGRFVVIALVLINLIWLAYNVLTPRTTNPLELSTTDNKIDTVDALKASPAEVVNTQKPAKTQATKNADNYQTLDDYKKPAKQKQANKSPQSISELMASVDNNEPLEPTPLQTKSAPIKPTKVKPQPKPLQTKPAQAKPIQPKPRQTQLAKPAIQQQAVEKPIAVKPKSIKSTPTVTKPDQTTLAKKANKPLAKPPVAPVKPAKNAVKNKVAKSPPKQTARVPRQLSIAERNAKNNIPLLRQMPTNFSAQIPKLDINVYVYSEESDNSFVIINMRKYRVNDQIGSDIKLDTIGKDAIILNKNGTKFRIARP
ncbi:MAG: general secretion pathway protein GspB [Methylococcales bacterium]